MPLPGVKKNYGYKFTEGLSLVLNPPVKKKVVEKSKVVKLA